ncbi:MAG: hypothetical protein LBU17_11640 [Treponema sp.]|jgi:hypothetical protein|nr:hypothetical protein [Treponema sp.]
MTIQQTIEIPADRRVYFDLPRDIPIGEAKVEFTITLVPALKKEEPKLGMITSEQLKTLIGDKAPSLPKGCEVSDRREAFINLAWQRGKPHKEHSLFKYAGCLKDSGIFDGDSMDIQREMRREWE